MDAGATQDTDSGTRFRDSGAAVAIAMAVMNVTVYGFTILAAHLMGPQGYGAVAALLATLLIVGVVQLALQTTAARRISADPSHVATVEQEVLRVSLRVSLVLGGALVVLSPVIDRLLRLDSLATAVMVGVIAVPLSLFGGLAGILQGERRWWPLALVYAASGVPRLAAGIALMVWRPTPFWAMVAVLVGTVCPVLVGWWALRGGRHGVEHVEGAGAGLVAEVAHNAQALLAFLALSNVDIVVARNVLTTHQAGLYASGLILVKAVLFLPQFVVVVAFPSLSTEHGRSEALGRAVGLTAAAGLVAVAAAYVGRSLALVFVGGQEYAAIESRLWAFALLGTVLALLQLLVYAAIARQDRVSAVLVWVGFVTLVAAGLTAGSVERLLLVVSGVDVVLTLVLLGRAFRAPAPSTA